MAARKLPRMTADEFIAWSADRPDGERYELVGGEVVAMAAERAVHARVKHRIARVLEDAIRAAGLSCEAFPDGMAVRVDDGLVYEPDALVRCGEPLPDDAIELGDPVVVVEVLSPSTGGRDKADKLEGYFRLPSLRHYLIVKTETRRVIHHRRENGEGAIATRIVGAGDELRLEPPGLRFAVAELFP